MSKAFKKAFMGGFRKKDVIQYIADLEKKNLAEARETAEELASLRERCAELEAKLSELSESEKAALSRAQGLERELSETASGRDELSEKAIALSKENSDLLLQIAELKKEDGILREKLAAARAEKDNEKAPDTSESERIIKEEGKKVGEHGKVIAGEVKKIVRAKIASVKKEMPEKIEKIKDEAPDKVSDLLNYLKKK